MKIVKRKFNFSLDKMKGWVYIGHRKSEKHLGNEKIMEYENVITVWTPFSHSSPLSFPYVPFPYILPTPLVGIRKERRKERKKNADARMRHWPARV
jgi:hypothetical protein